MAAHQTAPFSLILSEARQLRDSFLIRNENSRREKIRSALRSVEQSNAADDALFLPHASSYPSCSSAIPQRPYQMLRSLPRVHNNHTRHHITLPAAEKLPQYSAWVPVRKSYAFDQLEEAYIPYLGDGPEEFKKAMHAFTNMSARAQPDSAFDLPSDGEVGEDAHFWSPNPTEPVPKASYGMLNAAMRAANRHAALHVASKYGTYPSVLEALRDALHLPGVCHVQAVIALAQKRASEAAANKKRLDHSRKLSSQLKLAIFSPNSRSLVQDAGRSSASGVLQHFCFVCQVFCCDVHKEARLVPREQIPDVGLRRRIRAQQAHQTHPCSPACHLHPRLQQGPAGIYENKPWTVQEHQLLGEALSLFPEDPCRLSLILGSRNCQEVGQKLVERRSWKKGSKNAFLQHSVAEHSVIFSENRQAVASSSGRQNMDSDGSDTEDEPILEKVRRIVKERNGKKGKTVRRRQSAQNTGTAARKTVFAATSEGNGDEDHGSISLIPCDHEGACDKNEACSCFSSQRVCYPSCGCNATRYIEESGAVVRWGESCSMTSAGCECMDGYCNSSECPCFHENKTACMPDECACDCRIPPWEISVRERRCKNADIIIRRHKKTFIGRSKVEGYGLFAGEYFDTGDMVGEYVGGQWHFDKADSALAVGEVKGRTYAYDVVNVTIDGTLFGAKARFVNCSVDKKTQNCHPELVSVKGHWHLFLIANRPIGPGTEFLFDYNLNGKEEPEWLDRARRDAQQASLE